jgi:hypothetical protein
MVISFLLQGLGYSANTGRNEDLINLLQLDEEEAIKSSFQIYC